MINAQLQVKCYLFHSDYALRSYMDFDLNIMRPLRALLEDRHVSSAAERCGVSQPAMSRTLARLRTTFADDLLVRSGRRYERTPRADQLLAEVRDILDRIEAALSGDRFDARQCDIVFRLASTDYISAVLLPHVLRDLQNNAPTAALDLTRSDERTVDELSAGRIDVAILSVDDAPATLNREKLFDDDYVCLVAADHSLTHRSSVTLDRYLKERHIVIDVWHGLQPPIDRPLAARGVRRDVGYRTPFLTSAAYAVASTSMVLTIPRRQALSCTAGLPVRIVRAPSELDNFTYTLAWHKRLEASAAHAWFRERIRAIASQVTVPAKRR
jgi:DNA-binding transcriptional LysR family regulator